MDDRQWYYARDNNQQGPLPEAELARLFAEKKLPGTTLVWAEHLPNWLPAQEVDVFRNSSSAKVKVTPPPVPRAEPKPKSEEWVSHDGYSTVPHPWHRFFARGIDNLIYSVPFAITFIALMSIANAISHLDKEEATFAMLIILIFLSPLPFFFEPMLLALLGGTPGKLLLNIRLRTSAGERLSFVQALQRTGAVWLRGGPLAACVPFIGGIGAIALAVYQFTQLTNNGIVSWDRNQNFVYEHGPITGGRIGGLIAVGICGFIWFILMSVAMYMMMHDIMRY